MAAPIIVSVTPATATLSQGQFVDVVVVASDPDNAAGRLSGPVADSQGNVVQWFVDIVRIDPLTFGIAQNPDGLAVTVTGPTIDPTNANRATYRITAF